MSLIKSVQFALACLSARNRIRLGLLVVTQCALGLLDLVGVLALGLVVVITSALIAPNSNSTLARPITSWIDNQDDPVRATLIVAAIGAGFLFGKTVVSFVLTRKIFRFLAHRQAEVSSDLARRVLSQSLWFLHIRSSQEISYALTRGVNALTLGLLGQGSIALAEASLMLILLVTLLIINPVLTIAMILYFAVVGLALHKLLGAWADSLGTRGYAAELASHTAIQEAVNNFRELAISGRRPGYIERFGSLRWEASSVQADQQLVAVVSKYVYEIALILGAALLTIWLAYSSSLVASLGTLAISLIAATRLLPSLVRMQGALLAMNTARAEAAGTFSLIVELNDRPRISLSTDETTKNVGQRILSGIQNAHSEFEPALELIDVSISYADSTRPAIVDVSLRLGVGESLGIVGRTGAGKSTLADLILGLAEPSSGQISIGGRIPSDATHLWPGAIAYVPQDISIIAGTIRENLTVGYSEGLFQDSSLWAALDSAAMADFLRDQRDGLDTIVGESGVRLSGGQRQRLGLARALLTRPKLLVLDEATSALDATTEKTISETLSQLSSEVTLVIIAHRLATIIECDHVLYLDEGRVLGEGTFAEVVRSVPELREQAKILGIHDNR